MVAAVNKGSAKDPALMRLLQVLAFHMAILDKNIMKFKRGINIIGIANMHISTGDV